MKRDRGSILHRGKRNRGNTCNIRNFQRAGGGGPFITAKSGPGIHSPRRRVDRGGGGGGVIYHGEKWTGRGGGAGSIYHGEMLTGGFHLPQQKIDRGVRGGGGGAEGVHFAWGGGGGVHLPR